MYEVCGLCGDYGLVYWDNSIGRFSFLSTCATRFSLDVAEQQVRFLKGIGYESAYVRPVWY